MPRMADDNHDQIYGLETPKGGGLFEFRHPPLHPKVLEPGLVQFEILGETVGAKGA